MNSSSEDK